MDKGTVSILVFGVYLSILGLLLALFPNIALPIFGFDLVSDIWIRLLGLSFFLISGIYYLAIKENWVSFYSYTVFSRMVVAIFILLNVSFGLAPIQLLIFGLTDILCAVWTLRCIRHTRDVLV